MIDVNRELQLFDFERAFDPNYYLYFYESILTPERLRAEIDFLVRYTELGSPKKILDMACGHGRHSNELAKLGHSVTGIDASRKFLDKAIHSARDLDVKVQYLCEDMRNELFFEEYERIYVLFNALGYFEDEDNERVFRNLYRALAPGGILCFDTHNRDAFQSYYQPFSVLEKNGDYMIDQTTFETLTGRCWTKRIVLMNQKFHTFTYSVRFYNPTDIASLFKKIGFSSCLFYGDWDGSFLGGNSKGMIVVAKK